MADFRIGDRVRTKDGRVGEIVGELPSVKQGPVVPGKELKEVVRFWKVRLDETGEEKAFPEDELEKLL